VKRNDRLKLFVMNKNVDLFFFVLFSLLLIGGHQMVFAQSDLYSDTWVATDALGRVTPTADSIPLKTDKARFVGIFYITWHDEGKFGMSSPYAGDVSKVLQQSPEARLDGKNPAWKESSLHWGEPECGYFLSQDKYVIRRDLSMLADAGVDVLILDVTNAVLYWDEWKALFETMQQMRDEGNNVPKFCFWAFNGNVVSVVQQLYDKIYKPGRYRDFWFVWQGRPLLLYNATPSLDANGGGYQTSDYSADVKSFFTLRNMWWGYYEWNGKRYVGTDDDWCFGYEMNDKRVASLSPEALASKHEGRAEEMAVTPAQHPISITGKSWRRQTGEPALNAYDLPDSAYVPWLGKTVRHSEGYGIYFQDRWDEAVKADPDFIYINDWNEWTAGKYASGLAPGSNTVPGPTTFLGRKNNFYFVDQYNAEFNRSIQPMKDGYTDNYYMQMVENIRRYKGVCPIPRCAGYVPISIDGRFADWDGVRTAYRDTRGDVAHRDHNGYGGYHYVNTSGRNDILVCKVAMERRYVDFYAETDSALTPCTDKNWMLLFLDTDRNASTGWCGYEYVINYSVRNPHSTTICKYVDGSWQKVGTLAMAYAGNKLEIKVPRKFIGTTDGSVSFDFKWADNPASLKNAISLCTDGDTAPNRRFNYRFVWSR
jgi:hypothetical protein